MEALTPEEHALILNISQDQGTDEKTRRRAKAVVAFLECGNIEDAAAASGFTKPTTKKIIEKFTKFGWQSLLTVLAPRGGDFLARYDQGFWAERLTRVLLDRSSFVRAIPYGTSRSEPFTDLDTFRKYSVSEALLQAWSSGQRWKRPDLILVPRAVLREKEGNDAWTPDLLHFDNDRCSEFVNVSTAAIEVETSLWQVKKASVPLSFTVKEEDLGSLRNWVRGNHPPLYVLQVFYDQAYALPFSKLEQLIREGIVKAVPDRFTQKPTYNVPLAQGGLLGDIPEPEVEGRIFKAPNGRVTVYGRLTGSHIEPINMDLLEAIAKGQFQ